MRFPKSVLKREVSRLVAWGFLLLALLLYPLFLALFSAIALFHRRKASRRRTNPVMPTREPGT